MDDVEAELMAAIRRVLESPSRRKLVVAGPGTGKTTLFRKLLEGARGGPDERLVLTFINNLRNDLDAALGSLADVYTLHSYCLGRLYAKGSLRTGLTDRFECIPGLAHLIARDWEFIEGTEAPHFVRQMRNLEDDNSIAFYLGRGNYYDAVDFDDTVYRVYARASTGVYAFDAYQLVLIDEYQDFNALEAGVIELLAMQSPILVAGDDDQALYSQLRNSSCKYIRLLRNGGEFDVFELPFCMRCTKVIVDAVNDVLGQAKKEAKLEGRIAKPYRHFPPAKGADSDRYPTIARVRTTVQRANANYMGRYVAEVASQIPPEEVEEANKGNYPALLVIVAKPYRTQIVDYLDGRGFDVDTKRDSEAGLKREDGLVLLKAEPRSNAGWRIVLESESEHVVREVIRSSREMDKALVDLIPSELRARVLREVDVWEVAPSEEAPEPAPVPEASRVTIRVTSFEGAKGLSAQHVIIAGLHEGELPRNAAEVQDIEICRFLVGLTRTRKRCYLLHTGRFAQAVKKPSVFLSWIARRRYADIDVDAQYWRKRQR